MNKNQPFRQHHLTRALRAARDAGMTNPRVEVRLPGGAQLFVSGGEVVPQSKKSTQRGALSRDRPPRVAGGLAMPALPGATGTDNAKRRR
jgi:hypothetical protein